MLLTPATGFLHQSPFYPSPMTALNRQMANLSPGWYPLPTFDGAQMEEKETNEESLEMDDERGSLGFSPTR